LHDTVEDTDATFEEVDGEFGKVIGDMVREVTDDKSLPKAVRKQKQVEHAPHLSVGAKHIKLGDKTSNVKDIHATPPPNWSNERKLEYLNWTESIVSIISGTNPKMEEVYFEVLTTARKSLEQEEK
jgi:guanosine-3',5'-bis(diphosphate) 3'-pyrophosphohydrolase